MAAIHNLSDNLHGILMELSQKTETLQEQNIDMAERTKALEANETVMKAKMEDLAATNVTLHDRITVLEQQLKDEAESKLKLNARLDELNGRLAAVEDRVRAYDSLIGRLESCEKKLASFYGDDTNILGRVGFLETRFKEFKNNEDAKFVRFTDGLNNCNAHIKELRVRVEKVEEGLVVARRLTDYLNEAKLDKSDVDSTLQNFKTEHRLLDEDSIVVVTAMANDNKESINALCRSEQEKEAQLKVWLDKIREDIEQLQRNSEPAHKYECFGSDQAVKIYQIETRLKELEGITSASLDSRLALMEGKLQATTSHLDRVLGIEAFVNGNFDRIGTDYVHLSRLIAEIKQEMGGNEQKMQEFFLEMRSGARGTEQPQEQQVVVRSDDERLALMRKDIEAIELMINSADYRMSVFADKCKDSLMEIQANNDKKIDILVVWVSKNINILAASTSKRFKQLQAACAAGGTLLSGKGSSAGHCLSCNVNKRPKSASYVRARTTESKSPIYMTSHARNPPADDTNDNASWMTDATDSEGAGFKMTVPESLRTKVSHFRQSEEGERLGGDRVLYSPAAEEGSARRVKDDRRRRSSGKVESNEDNDKRTNVVPSSRPSSANAHSLPRNFFKSKK